MSKKSKMRSIGLIAAIALCATTVLADTPRYSVHWTFTSLALDTNRIEDYSTNLDIPLAATLSTEAVNAGWSCIRTPVSSSKNAEVGTIDCRNGREQYLLQTVCSTIKQTSQQRALIVFLPGGSMQFQVSCTTK
jgi:hypothetical protein